MRKVGIHWSVLTIGNLSRNRFWGEDESTAHRAPLCTATLVRAGDAVIVVDPPLPPEEMPALLDRRAGLKVSDVTHVYLTHCHGDHRVGLEAFPQAAWQMPDLEVEFWREHLPAGAAEWELLTRILPVAAEDAQIAPGVTTLHLPGHTPGLAGLAFDDRDGFRVVIASDAVMTRDFFEAGEGYFNSFDFTLAGKSIDRVRSEADIIVPGHDNYSMPHALAPSHLRMTMGFRHPHTKE